VTTLTQQHDRVVLSPGGSPRELLFSVAVAFYFAVALDYYSHKAATSKQPGRRDIEPTIDVDAITADGKSMVRLRFSVWSSSYFLSVAQSLELSRVLRLAATAAQKSLKWREQRNPAILLGE
jgi:hypothetical protein